MTVQDSGADASCRKTVAVSDELAGRVSGIAMGMSILHRSIAQSKFGDQGLADDAVVGPAGPNDPGPVGSGHPPIIAWHEFRAGDEPPARHHRYRRVAARTLSKAWGDSLFGLSSQAAFWCALSTAPMLLALLGLTGLIAPLFGPNTLTDVHVGIGRFLHGVFNPEVANNLVGDTVNTILNAPRGDVVSVGLIISLWAGSSAISALVEAITIAYRQHEYRHPAVERLFALGLYLVALLFGILLLPLLAIGPDLLIRWSPPLWHDTVSTVVSISYYPVTAVLIILLLATLYKVAPGVAPCWWTFTRVTAGHAGRMSSCRTSVGSSPRSFGPRR